MAARSPRGFGQYGGVARAVEKVGERWALLIIRDLLAGARRYSDLKSGLPRIPTNILSDRLKELQEAGVIRRVPAVRGGYELTALGRALGPVVLELERWGWASLGQPAADEVFTADAIATTLRAAFQANVAEGLPPTEYVLHVGSVSVSVIVHGSELDILPIGPDALPNPGARIATPSARDVFEADVSLGAPEGMMLPVLVHRGDSLRERFGKTFWFRGLRESAQDAAGIAL